MLIDRFLLTLKLLQKIWVENLLEYLEFFIKKLYRLIKLVNFI